MTSIRHFMQIVESAGREGDFYDAVLQALSKVASVRRASGSGHLLSFPSGVTVRVARWDSSSLSITDLKSRSKGGGHAKAAMREIMRAADEAGAPICLEAKPFGKGGLDSATLAAFYERLGFRQVTEDGFSFMRREPNIVESTGRESLPEWFQRGRPLTRDDLDRLDASEFLSGKEFDYEWRLCKVPISVLPPYDQGGVTDEDRNERFRSIEDWYRTHGVEKALMTAPVVMLITLNGSIRLLDGWHRTEIARRQGAETVVAVVAHGDPDYL